MSSIARQILNKIFGFKVSAAEIKKDLYQMNIELKDWEKNLIEWDKEELNIFSLNSKNKIFKSPIGKILKGFFTSIYEEPLMIFAAKKYDKEGHHALVLCKTTDYLFKFRKKENLVWVICNESAIGAIEGGDQLMSTKDHVLASFQKHRNESGKYFVNVGERQIGTIKLEQESTKHVQRAFEYVDEMNEKEEIYFLALVFYKIISDYFPKLG